MRPQRLFPLVPPFLTLLGLACAGRGPAPAPPPGTAARASARAFTILSINDTYRVAGVDGGAAGGLARVRTLRADLESEGREVLVLHAGDLLYPAFLSRRYHGEQMIDLMNRLDGFPGVFDDRLFFTFGNHEFDKSKVSDAPLLDHAIEASEFTWLGSDIVFSRDQAGEPWVAAPNLHARALLSLGGVRIGIFSLTTDEAQPAYVTRFTEPVATARSATAELRREGAEVVIGLTHQALPQDLQILEELGEEGPDLIVGGHEHERQGGQRNGRWVVKADAEARSAVVTRVTLDPEGGVEVAPEWIDLADDQPAPDPEVVAAAESWLDRFDQEYCVEKLGQPRGCLSDRIGFARTRLGGEELSIRRFETSLGDWIADRMLSAFADQGAQVAFVNSGSLRLNHDIPAGSAISRRDLEELFAYPAPLRLLRLDGRTLQQVMSRSVEGWTGNGWWLQVSGLAFRHDPAQGRAESLTLLTESGPRPVDPDEEILAVTVDYLVDPSGSQDGYTMLHPDQVVAEGPDLKELVVEVLEAAGEEGIGPRVEGRICNQERPGPCLALSR